MAFVVATINWLNKLLSYIYVFYEFFLRIIKTSGSESRGQEEAARARAYSGQCTHYSALFTRMVRLNFLNAVAQPLL